MMNREIGYIHFAVLLFGLAGLFAKFVSLSAIHIVLGRVFFASIFLLFVLLITKKSFFFREKKTYLYFIIIGFVLALHWASFFYSIQRSTVAIGLITFATFPIFANFLEPIIFKELLFKKTLVLAFLTLIGIFFVVPEFSIHSDLTIGAIWGIVSAFTFAVLSMLNRAFVKQYSSIVIGFYQNLFAFFWLFPFYFVVPLSLNVKNIALLLLLGVLFTGIAHVLYIQGLDKVNVRTASIIASLEPVYGIIAAAILLSEIPEPRQWIGIMIILFSVTYISITKEKKSDSENIK